MQKKKSSHVHKDADFGGIVDLHRNILSLSISDLVCGKDDGLTSIIIINKTFIIIRILSAFCM